MEQVEKVREMQSHIFNELLEMDGKQKAQAAAVDPLMWKEPWESGGGGVPSYYAGSPVCGGKAEDHRAYDDEPADPKKRGLCSRRDLAIGNRPEKMTKAEFILRRGRLEELLEQSSRWKGVFKDTKEVVVPIVPWLSGKKTNTMVIRDKPGELYGLLRLKLNTATNALCHGSIGRNGSELYRRLSREFNQQAEGTGIALLDQIVSMGKRQANTFDETYVLMKTLRRQIEEYSKLSQSVLADHKTKCWGGRSLVDPQPQAKADMKHGAATTRDFQALLADLEELDGGDVGVDGGYEDDDYNEAGCGR